MDDDGIELAFSSITARGVSADTPYFASMQPKFSVSFPKYRIRSYDGRRDVLFVEEKLRRRNSVWKRRLRIRCAWGG